LSWCNSQFFYRQILGRSLRKFSCNHHKCHSSMWNWLFGLPGRILCVHSPLCKIKWWACSWLCSSLSRLSRCRWVWTFHLQLMLSFPNACLIITVSITLSLKLEQNFMLFLCGIHREITLGQIDDSK
jgi:hypothetical protein